MINKLFIGDSNTDYALFMDDDMVDEVYLGDTKIYSKPANIYGWHVDPSISDPSDAITYIRDARGKNTARMTNIQQTVKGYNDIEYIKSTGTQRISTDIIINTSTELNADMKLGNKTGLGSSGNAYIMFGTTAYIALTYLTSEYTYVHDSTFYYGFEWHSGMTDNRIVATNDSTGIPFTERNIWKLKTNSFSIGSTSITTSYSTTSQPINKGMTIFGRTRENDYQTFEPYEMYLYGFKVFDNGILVNNLIPVERISDGETGLIDTISRTFYPNTGTGTFIKGNYVTTNYWFDYGDWENAFFMPKPCMLKSNGIVDYYLDPNDYSKKLEDGTISDVANADYDGNAMMEWPLIYYKFEGLEEKGYKAVEYIKSTGTQIIITDIVPKYTYKVETDIKFDSTIYSVPNSDYMYIFGISGAATNGVYCAQLGKNTSDTSSTDNIRIRDGYYSTATTFTNVNVVNRTTLIMNRPTSYYGTSSLTTNQPIEALDPPVTPMPIFGISYTSGGVLKTVPLGNRNMYLYDFKVYDSNNNLIHRLIPVERQSDNELGLYDTLTDKFYTNSGTGTFIKGNYITTGDGWFYCADRKVNNSYKCWNNYNSWDKIGQHFYTAIYNVTATNNCFRSLSDKYLTQSNGAGYLTGNTEINYATANNTSSVIEWYTEVWADRILISALMILISKSLNDQASFGRGLDTGGINDIGNYVTGTLNNKGLFWGDLSSGTSAVKVFGMENFYGCLWRRTAGLVGNSTGCYWKLTMNTADGTEAVGYNSIGAHYHTATLSQPAYDYVTKMNFGDFGYLPIAVGGSSSTYWTEDFYPGTGYAIIGGCISDGETVGSTFINFGNAFTVTSGFISTSLSCKPYFIGLPKITTPNVRISKEKVVDFITNDSATVEAQLYVQDVIDLPEYNTLANRTLLAGSTAIVISTHEIYMLDNNNEWILQGSTI